MLADPELIETQLFGQQGLLGRLLEIRAKRPRRRMQRHHEQAKVHFLFRPNVLICSAAGS